MTMTEPLPAGGNGLANWQDLINNWREADAEFIQDRMITRFADLAGRNAAYAAPPAAGRLIYRADLGYLEMSNGSAWLSYRPMPQYMVPAADTAAQVVVAHSGAAGLGVVLTPTYVGTNADFRAKGGVLTVDSTGVAVKTGAATSKLTTNATDLLVDTPLSAPSITLTGTGTVFSAPGKSVAVGSITADSGVITNLTVSTTLTGGVLNGSSGLIGGVTLASNRATAASGFRSVNGIFYGGSTAAAMKFFDGTTTGTAVVQVATNYAQLIGDTIYLDGDIQWRTGGVGQYRDAGGTVRGYMGVVIYSASDPGAANFPQGALWIS